MGFRLIGKTIRFGYLLKIDLHIGWNLSTFEYQTM